MLRPKIMIQKKKIFDSKGWNRYYGNEVIDLNYLPIYTEKQLCAYILNKFGEGHFCVYAFQKGRMGFWIFWKGTVNREGFMMEKRKVKSSEDIQLLKDEYDTEEDSDYKMELGRMITEEERLKDRQKYGFVPSLKPSGRRGEFTFWEDGE